MSSKTIEAIRKREDAKREAALKEARKATKKAAAKTDES